ncbi:hypothetical protein DSM106972_094970 [Dulcicalothrix desertica PCC 7102]|uniref:Uncharacterized protein n=1 Tax=Dulcicalothrix desertica PCC 7102 TaxID=232991 RepID=A0A3S1BS73_9CYAN|nr:hypothetical protein [Dulcicalothrix desertica]RUS93960.1 hypothetical protein DSM106972_094970 [Dulcicalothrix desertica PCC 7102]TWH62624.1 hypothetical protein CAL7102_00120 [Dulcicalothrix desertica PCC 7102]
MSLFLAALSIGDITSIIQAATNVIQAIAVVISLLYLARQVQESTKAAKGATYQAIISSFAELEALITQDEQVARIYTLGKKEPNSLSENEVTRFNEIMSTFFNLYENLYYQYKNNLLEEELWAGWCRNMRTDLEETGAAKWWENKGYLYSKSFREYVKLGKCPKS